MRWTLALVATTLVAVPLAAQDPDRNAAGSGKPPEHTSEMDYVYRVVPANVQPGDWPPVQRYWANFIRSGNPNGAGLPHWPGVAEQDAALSIAPTGIQVRHGARAAICGLMFKDVNHPPSAVAPN